MNNKNNVARTLPGIPIGKFLVRRAKPAVNAPEGSVVGVTTNHPFDPKKSVLTDKPVTRPRRNKPIAP